MTSVPTARDAAPASASVKRRRSRGEAFVSFWKRQAWLDKKADLAVTALDGLLGKMPKGKAVADLLHPDRGASGQSHPSLGRTQTERRPQRTLGRAETHLIVSHGPNVATAFRCRAPCVG